MFDMILLNPKRWSLVYFLLLVFAFTPLALADDPDNDGDGYVESVDCDDSDSFINPGAREWCYGGIDNNCDGITVESLDSCGCCDLPGDANNGGRRNIADVSLLISMIISNLRIPICC